MIEWHVRYGIDSWCFGNTTAKNSVQKSCDKFLKIAFKTNDQIILEQKMENKEILTTDQLLFLELGLSMYKIYNHTYPSAITSFFSSNSRTKTLRSRNRLYSSTPRIQTTKQALGYKGPYIWRHIPDFVKYKNESNEEFRSFADFKNNLRTFIVTAGIYECSRAITGIKMRHLKSYMS